MIKKIFLMSIVCLTLISAVYATHELVPGYDEIEYVEKPGGLQRESGNQACQSSGLGPCINVQWRDGGARAWRDSSNYDCSSTIRSSTVYRAVCQGPRIQHAEQAQPAQQPVQQPAQQPVQQPAQQKPSCTSECTIGSVRCIVGEQRQVCADTNNDGCFEWTLQSNCDTQTNWYNTFQFKTIDMVCTTASLHRKEFRDYRCEQSSASCVYSVSNEAWEQIGTGNKPQGANCDTYGRCDGRGKCAYPQPTVSVSVDTDRVEIGNTVKMGWSSTNADSCTFIFPNLERFPVNFPVSGSRDVGGFNQAGSVYLRVTCFGKGGSASGNKLIFVAAKQPPPQLPRSGDACTGDAQCGALKCNEGRCCPTNEYWQADPDTGQYFCSKRRVVLSNECDCPLEIVGGRLLLSGQEQNIRHIKNNPFEQAGKKLKCWVYENSFQRICLKQQDRNVLAKVEQYGK